MSQVVYSVGLVVACLMTFYVTLIYAELGTSMNISLGTGYSFTLASTFVFAKLIEDLKVSAPSFLFSLRAHFVSSLLRAGAENLPVRETHGLEVSAKMEMRTLIAFRSPSRLPT